jgi:hypothetical protein
MIKLTYTNSCNLGGVYYIGGYENILFIDSVVCKPEYENTEDGYNNDQQVFIKEYHALKKVYKFEAIAPEYIANTLSFMAQHDDIKISWTNGLYQSQIRNVQVSVNWEDQFNDCMATIEVSFEQDDQIVNTACCVE